MTIQLRINDSLGDSLLLSLKRDGELFLTTAEQCADDDGALTTTINPSDEQWVEIHKAIGDYLQAKDDSHEHPLGYSDARPDGIHNT
jgi:hypothetical protein